jgi:hypothetical protein
MDLKELRALLRLMEGNDVEEVEVEEGGRRIRIRRRASGDGGPRIVSVPVASPLPAASSVARKATSSTRGRSSASSRR